MAQPFITISQPVATPPTIGLIATMRALRTIVEDTATADGHWQNGFSFSPEACDDDSTGIFDFCDTPADLDLPEPRGTIQYRPFAIWAGDRCSAMSFDSRDYQARATRKLLSCQSRKLAQELESGHLARQSAWPNSYFMDSSTITLTSTDGEDPGDALACLEDYLADCACGATGQIHATRGVASKWVENSLVSRDPQSGLLITELGTVVIADGGYRGMAPYGLGQAANVKWAYATTPIYVHLGPLRIFPDRFNDAVNHSDNTIEFRAMRMAAAYWDECCSAGAGVQIEACSNIGS